jgi:hypothetical protein
MCRGSLLWGAELRGVTAGAGGGPWDDRVEIITIGPLLVNLELSVWANAIL